MVKLVLFDIDGTLLDASGGGRPAFEAAFRNGLGWEQDISYVSFAGATDLGIFRNLVKGRGMDSDEELERRFFERLPLEMDAQLCKTPPCLMPGVEDLLKALSTMNGVRLGIVTGNIETTARIKLRHAGIGQYFSFGGFGCDHADRVEIARRAVERGGGGCGVLIGDTPNDVNAARANGLRSIAVAGGHFSVADLQACGADFVFESFADTERVLAAISE